MLFEASKRSSIETSVLIIGGDGISMLKILLQDPHIEKAEFIELDYALLDLSIKNILPENKSILNDPRVKIIQADGRQYLKNKSNAYDLILLQLPDPVTAQINRYYTYEFYKIIKKALSDNGVFSFAVTSSENYIGPELADFLLSLSSSLHLTFNKIILLPGTSCRFIATGEKGTLTTNPKLLENRLLKRQIKAKYIRSYYLNYIFSEQRIKAFQTQLKSYLTQTRVWINRDFHPISYYFDMTFWGAQFSPLFGNFLQNLKNDNPAFWIILFPALVAVLLICSLFRKKGIDNTIFLAAIFTGGITESSLQIIVLIAFQILYGSVYYKIGIVFMMFMVGMSTGAAVSVKKLIRKNTHARLLLLQCIYALTAAVIPFILKKTALLPTGKLSDFIEIVVFPVIPAFTGFIGGLQFPVAASLYQKQQKRLGLSSGMTYGTDLAGASIGAFIISSFLIPLAGIVNTCKWLVLINLSTALLLGRLKQRIDSN